MLINNNLSAFAGSGAISPLADNSSPLGSTAVGEKLPEKSFGAVLGEELKKSGEELRFSKHALNRISQRSIDVEPALMEQVANAVDNAKAKGITDALILGGNSAFIVNVPTGTVITAMNSDEMKQNIITNIDGTVII